MPCEFSLIHYEECLELMKGQDVILTHDIDLFPPYALELAKLENKHGIKAIYYVLLHSEWYNALSPENIQIFRQILELGHEIGLHYDTRFTPTHPQIRDEGALLGKLLDINVWAFSQHVPSLSTTKIPFDLDRASMQRKYIADSAGRWREGCMCKWIGKQKLVVNCHPIWWIQPVDTLEELQQAAFKVVVQARKKWQAMIQENLRNG